MAPHSDSAWWVVATCSALILMTLHALLAPRHDGVAKLKAPTAGQRCVFEPSWLLQRRFVTQSRAIIQDGYQMLKKSKTSLFRIRRVDADIFVLSNEYLDQLRHVSEDKLSVASAYAKTFYGRYTSINMIHCNDHVQTQALVHKLTPLLGELVPLIKDEVDYALQMEMPSSCRENSGEWAKVEMYTIILKCISRISARIFVGYPASRDEQWLAVTREFAENFFTTCMTLRRVPRFLHPLVAPLLPSCRRLQENVKTAKRILAPVVRARTAKQASDGCAKSTDVLQFMMDSSADMVDGSPETLAHRQLFLSLAALHTTSIVTTNALLDLCAHPDFLSRLRSEANNALARNGHVWKKSTLARMPLLDSCIKESLRKSPPAQLTFNRIVQHPMTLSSTITLPVGTHIAMPLISLLHDPAHVAGDPLAFEPFRFVNDTRHEPAQSTNPLFARVDKSDLNFGYGKHACPGRHFANVEIKLLLSALLVGFDFAYPSGHTRPDNITMHEFEFPNPTTCLFMRRRANLEVHQVFEARD